MDRQASPGPKDKSKNIPQTAPGAQAAVGHVVENSIPLSIFPIATDKYCFCFCGIPGRGKTHISNRLKRYLSFFHAVPVEVFNAGEYRRKLYDGHKDAEWFNPSNLEAVVMREHCNERAIEDMEVFLKQHSNGVVIFDSVNSTFDRRHKVWNRMHACGAKVVFIEVQNSSPEYLERSYKTVAQTCPDYVGICEEEALQDYKRRVELYVSSFEHIGHNEDPDKALVEERSFSYLVCDHSREHFVTHHVRGYLPQKVVQFIMIMRTTVQSFYISRHGQSEYNVLGRIGGDSELSPHGWAYSRKLATFVKERVLKDPVTGAEIPGRLWTSNMVRTKQTATFIERPTILIPDKVNPAIKYEWVQMRARVWHNLDELFAGTCDGMTYEEIEEQYPEEFRRRKVDKLAYRYPRGESYLDVIARLEPIIMEMERTKEPVLIIGHQGILRVVYAFYMGKTRAETPYVSIPLNTVVQLTPGAFTCAEQRHLLYTPPTVENDGQDELRSARPTTCQ